MEFAKYGVEWFKHGKKSNKKYSKNIYKLEDYEIQTIEKLGEDFNVKSLFHMFEE